MKSICTPVIKLSTVLKPPKTQAANPPKIPTNIAIEIIKGYKSIATVFGKTK